MIFPSSREQAVVESSRTTGFAMTRMTIITPSYRPDFELCVELNRSVLQFAPESVEHHILVPRSDLRLFADRLAGPRTHVRAREELLPGSWVRLPGTDSLLNLRWPFLPVRGWIEQQLVKLAAASACDGDVVLIVDSDVQFVRPLCVETFVQNGAARFYRLPRAIDAHLPNHIRWHRNARKLLGLPPQTPPHADYITSMVACDPTVVRQMLTRVESSTGLPWATALSRQVHFSEWTLYGVFMEELAGSEASSFVSDEPLCRGDWSTSFSKDEADEFLAQLGPCDVAAMMSSKTGTSIAVRRSAFADWLARCKRALTIAATFTTHITGLL